MTDPIPTIKGRLTDYSQVSVTCPFCHEEHFHGANNDYDNPGLRVSHCWHEHVEHGQYYIVLDSVRVEVLK